MDEKTMLKKMCHDFLTGTDIREICKNRHFAQANAASGVVIESLFLTGSGLEAAISSLSRKEIIILHLMNFKRDMEDIPFFVRIYGNEKHKWKFGSTYNERYRDIHKKVMSSFVHKGLMLVFYVEDWRAVTKLERVRFKFPAAFAELLPPLFETTEVSALPGDKGKDLARQKVMELAAWRETSSGEKAGSFQMNIRDGVLRIGDGEFSPNTLRLWKEESWRKAAWAGIQKDPRTGMNPIDAVKYIFSQLRENEWARPEHLSEVLNIFLEGYGVPDAEVICRTGLEWDCLQSLTINGRTCYRLSELETLPVPDPIVYLTTASDGTVIINLEKITFEVLRVIADISEMSMKNGILTASPSIIKMGRLWKKVSAHPVVIWLKENSPAFRKAFGTVAERWGRTIVHGNLKVARIRDLGLKVKIEKAFGDSYKLVVLNDEFIAFTADMLGGIEKLVRKEGKVIKVVKA